MVDSTPKGGEVSKRIIRTKALENKNLKRYRGQKNAKKKKSKT